MWFDHIVIDLLEVYCEPTFLVKNKTAGVSALQALLLSHELVDRWTPGRLALVVDQEIALINNLKVPLLFPDKQLGALLVHIALCHCGLLQSVMQTYHLV